MVTELRRAGYKDYREYKRALDAELQQSTESFVRIGYMLKLARDTDILRGSGYTDVHGFARAEYNIDKTLVSRFISINDRFSEGGNSDCLKEQYRGFGYAKLAIMLQLPDAVNEELTPAFSKADVLAVKEEVDAERELTDIEVLLEEGDAAQEAMESSLGRVIHQLGHDFPEMYAGFYRAVRRAAGEERELYRELQELLAPSGEGIHSVRIMGIGRLLLSVKDTGRDVTLTSIRSGEKESYTWAQVAAVVRNITGAGEEVSTAYEAVYGEKYPAGEEKGIAPVQPGAGQKKEEPKPKKQGKVTKAPKKMPPLPVPVTEENIPAVPAAEAPVPVIPEAEETVPVIPAAGEGPGSPAPGEAKTAETVGNTVAGSNSGDTGTVLPENGTGNRPEAAEIPNAEGNLEELENRLYGIWNAAEAGDFGKAEEQLYAARAVIYRMRREAYYSQTD